MMINKTFTSVVHVLMFMCLFCLGQPVLASVEAECRQEAQDYGIETELHDEYVNGCIESRGGVSVSASIEEDYEPPAESGEEANLEVGDEPMPE